MKVKDLSKAEVVRIERWAEELDMKGNDGFAKRNKVSVDMTKKDALILAKALKELLRHRY